MERLTKRNEYGGAYYPYCFKENTCGGFGSSEKCDECDFSINVCEKLAEYEDLEEQGLLVKLPCKVGDPVYCVHANFCGQDWCSDNCFDCKDAHMEIREYAFNIRMIDDIGITIFLTKEEAEKALAEMGE